MIYSIFKNYTEEEAIEILNSLAANARKNIKYFADEIESATKAEAERRMICPICGTTLVFIHKYEKSEAWGKTVEEEIIHKKCVNCGWGES
jgi:formate dehydrogenase maturation protein FdhE